MSGDVLRPLAGEGALARAGSLVLLCAADAVRLPGLLDTFGAGGDGRQLCRRLATLLSASGLDDAPALCAFGPAGDGLAVLVHGAAVVEVDAAGQTVRLDGATAVTWVDRVLAGPVGAVRAALAGTDPATAPDSWARLDGGVIRAGGLVFSPTEAASAIDDATSAASLDELEDTGAEPAPVSPAPVSPAPVSPAPVTPAPTPAPLPPPAHAPQVSPAPPAPVSLAPLPVLARPVQPVSVPPATPLPDTPDATAPTVRNEPPQPQGAILVLDDGAMFRLDASYVVGREPERDQDVVAGRARPLRIADREGVVSRVHARLVLEGQAVFVIDLGSSNGTHLCEPGSEVWMRIPPRTPVPIAPGTMVLFGRRGIRYEVR